MMTPRDSGTAGPSEPALTPEAAQAKINEVMSNPDDLYHQHPSRLGRPERVAEVTKLFEAAYPERPAGGEEPPASAPPGKQQENVGAISPEALGQALGPRPDGEAWNDRFLRIASESAQTLDASAADAAGIINYCEAQLSEEPFDPKATETTLREKWGQKYEREIAAAKLAVLRVDRSVWTGFLEFLDDSGLGDDPVLVAWFAERGRPLLEALEKLHAVYRDPKHPYHGRFAGTPAHEKAVSEVQDLFQKVCGTLPVG